MKELYCHQKMITVIDGMAVVQAMGKPSWIKACAQWADHFTAILDSKCSDYDEVHLVFDRYDLRTLLKESTRERRQGGMQTTHQLGRCQQSSSKQFQYDNQR